MSRYLIVVERGETSYGAYAPDVPGCVAVGESAEEALQLMKDALEGHLEVMVETGNPIPQVHSVAAEFVEIVVPSVIPVAS